jgi:tetratricopeptide (TPR) repeat protein
VSAYSTRDAARLLGLPPSRVRRLARAALPRARRATGRELRFSFQDLVLLRATKGLFDSRVPAGRIRRALERLAAQLPSGRPLSAIKIRAQGERIVAQHGDAVWLPDSGQGCFDFDLTRCDPAVALDARRRAAPPPVERTPTPPAVAPAREDDVCAEDWFALGCDLEATDAERARDGYRRCLELDPNHVDARINLGRLLHESGRNGAAESQFRLALILRPDEPTTSFNLGVVLEDQSRWSEALERYRRAIELDPSCTDAHYNAARLYQKLGDGAAALRHLQIYRRLTRDD